MFCSFLLVKKTVGSSELTVGMTNISKLMALLFLVVRAALDSSVDPNTFLHVVVGLKDKRVNC